MLQAQDMNMSGLVFRIAVEERTFELGEPVTVRLVLENEGTSTLVVPFDWDSVRFYISSGNETPRSFTPYHGVSHALGGGVGKLRPWESYTKELIMLVGEGARRGLNSLEFAFPVTGQYELSATVSVGGTDQPLRSNSATVVIDAPLPESHEAFQWLKEFPAMGLALQERSLFAGPTARQQLVMALETFASRYAASAAGAAAQRAVESLRAAEAQP